MICKVGNGALATNDLALSRAVGSVRREVRDSLSGCDRDSSVNRKGLSHQTV
jgi:hypothetical protein